MRVICKKCYGEVELTVLAGPRSEPTDWDTGTPSEVEGCCPHATDGADFRCPEMDIAIQRGLFGHLTPKLFGDGVIGVGARALDVRRATRL